MLTYTGQKNLAKVMWLALKFELAHCWSIHSSSFKVVYLFIASDGQWPRRQRSWQR